jgi:Ead/Ea22-like protein
MTHDELRKLAEAATQQQWEMVPHGNMPEVMCSTRDDWGWQIICKVVSIKFVEDAKFIAAANPKTVLELLDRIAELERIIERRYEDVAGGGP